MRGNCAQYWEANRFLVPSAGCTRRKAAIDRMQKDMTAPALRTNFSMLLQPESKRASGGNYRAVEMFS